MWYYDLLLLALFYHSVEAYKAAVVHYFPISKSTARKTILGNVGAYKKYATKARKKGADIVVFPEYALVTTDGLADPEEYALDIGDSIISTKLSAIARDNRVYLVVNLFEKIQDEIYNTNLVFDRNGTVIVKYHKMHLFNEYGLTPGSPNQTNTFVTDFGVTFGILTCFDIMFLDPSSSVLQKPNVTDVVFVTGWLPSYISLSIEQSYSIANKVNLLAANYGRLFGGRSGTGIYLSDGKRSSIVSDTRQSLMLVREVPPKVEQLDDVCQKKVPKHFESLSTGNNYMFYDLDLSQKHIRTKICNSYFCCTFDVTVEDADLSDTYKFMIFDDSVYYQTLKSDYHICTLLACYNSSINTCGAMTDVSTRFKKVSVTGFFTSGNSTFHRPITLSTTLTPLKHITYCDNESVVQVKSQNQTKVLVFGIFERKDSVVEKGRDFPNFQNFVMLFWGRPYAYPLFTTT